MADYRHGYYILDGHTAVPCDSRTWGASGALGTPVGKTEVGKTEISTVFLGSDHGYGDAVHIFETMVFGGPLDQEQERYGTWEEAEAGHAAMVKRVEQAQALDFFGPDPIETRDTLAQAPTDA